MLAAIVARARETRDYESGLEAVREAGATGFKPDRSLLDRLDAASAVQLLGDAENARVYAGVCAAEAELLEALGRPEEAGRLRNRAALVEQEARALPGAGRTPDP